MTIVDLFSRECLDIEVGFSLGAADVVRVMNVLKHERGVPKRIACDNGSEFAGGHMDLWAYVNNVTLDFSRPGKPTDNSYVETFDGSLRDECLNVHWFDTLDQAKDLIEA